MDTVDNSRAAAVNHDPSGPVAWPLALTFPERIAVLRSNPRFSWLTEPQADWAQQFLARWRGIPSLDVAPIFQRRLANLGVTESEFMTVVCTPAQVFATLLPPAWARQIERMRSREVIAGETTTPVPFGRSRLTVCQLLDLTVRRVRGYASRLAEECSCLPFSPETTGAFLRRSIEDYLLWVTGCSPPVERTADSRLRASARSPNGVAIPFTGLWRYPVLGRLIVLALERWSVCVCRVLSRLALDWKMLRDSFGQWHPGEIGGFAVGYPDHNGASAVTISFGAGLPLVYTPNGLSLDSTINETLRLLSRSGPVPLCHPLPVLDRGTYGWKLHLHPELVKPQERRDICYQLGAAAAARHILRGSRCSNVDPGRTHDLADSAAHWLPAIDRALGISSQTVLAEDRQDYLLEQLRIADPNDRGDVAEGCRRALRWMVECRTQLQSDAFVDRVASSEHPVLTRPLGAYFRLFHDILHPDALRDALERELILERFQVSTEGARMPTVLLTAEREATRAGSLPVFTAKLGDTALCLGSTSSPSYFAEPWPPQFRRRAVNLHRIDIEREMAVALGLYRYVPLPIRPQKVAAAVISREFASEEWSESRCATANLERFVLSLIHRKAYEEADSIAKGKTVLDWGCNDGYGLEILRLTARKVSGVDISSEMVECAKSRPALAGADIRLYNGLDAPFGDRRFDLVTSFQVIEHVTDMGAYLSAILSALVPDGVALFSTPNAAIRQNAGLRPWNAQHVVEFTWHELSEVLLQWFPAVSVRGLFARGEIDTIERRRIGAHRQNQLARRAGLTAPPLPSTPLTAEHTKMFGTGDLFYACDNLDNALDLLAICRLMSPITETK